MVLVIVPVQQMGQRVGQSPSSAGGSRCRSTLTFQFSGWVKVQQVGRCRSKSQLNRWVKVQQVGHGVGQSPS